MKEVQKYEYLPQHSNCVKFFRAWEEKQQLYLLTELCDKSLADEAETNHEFPEEVVWRYLIDLLQVDFYHFFPFKYFLLLILNSIFI